VLASLVLAEGGRQVLGRDHGADGRHLGGLEGAPSDAGQQRYRREVGDRQGAEGAGDGEAGVEEGAGGAGAEHQRPAVETVGEQACREHHRHHPQQRSSLEQRGDGGGAGEVVAEEREDEQRHRRAELADRLADPEDREVVVAGEPSVAGHIPHHIVRKLSCARYCAEFARLRPWRTSPGR
jgi:hypothetical protein